MPETVLPTAMRNSSGVELPIIYEKSSLRRNKRDSELVGKKSDWSLEQDFNDLPRKMITKRLLSPALEKQQFLKRSKTIKAVCNSDLTS